MSDAAYVKSFRLHRFGEDFAVEGYLSDPVRGMSGFDSGVVVLSHLWWSHFGEIYVYRHH